MAPPGMMCLAVLSALPSCLLSLGSVATAQMTLEIPETEFEAAEDYKPIPPVSMDVDLTGTLPEAVLEEMLGETPYDFVEVVWGMEVTGNWTDVVTGTGTLQVTDFTEGRGASSRVDPERYTGQEGFRMYNARLQSEGDRVFRLFAALPPDHGGVAFGTELDEVKVLFEALLCHMFEPDRTGCIDYPDEYYETELPELSKLHIKRKSSGYKIEFAARVRESRTHRERGYSSSDLTGRVGDVRGWVCDRVSWEADSKSCVENMSSDWENHDEYVRNPAEEAIHKADEEIENAVDRARAQATHAEIEIDVNTQIQEHIDDVNRHLEEEFNRIQARIAQADLERRLQEIEQEAQEQVDEAIRRTEAEIARQKAGIAQAEHDRIEQQKRDESARQMEEAVAQTQARVDAELARVEAKNAQIHLEIEIQSIIRQAEQQHDAAIAEAEALLEDTNAEEDATLAQDEPEDP
jgi:hypothetical protein